MPSAKRILILTLSVRLPSFPDNCACSNSRWLTGNDTYIGSWLTMVVSTPLSGPTTLPMVTLVLLTLPSIGEVMSV